MSIFRNILYFSILYFSCISVSYAQEIDMKSKYIYPTIESDVAFQSAIQSQEYVVIDFWAVWCRPCQLFLSEYEYIAKKFYKKIAFYKLDINQCPQTVEEYDTKMIPVIIIYKNGREIKRYVGLTAKERIILDLEEILKKKL